MAFFIKKFSIFWKILFAFLVVSVIPVAGSGFLIIITYQEVINKYLLHPELGPVSQEEINILHQNILIQTGLTVFLIVILISFSCVLLSRVFFSPLKKLTEEMKKETQGRLDTHLGINSRDEFEETAKFFNEMVEELRRDRAALEEAKNILEIKVQARTKELRELVDGQEEIIKERTKEIQEKMKELEKFNKLAVGRELKMVELKEEIKKLKEELEKFKEIENRGR